MTRASPSADAALPNELVLAAAAGNVTAFAAVVARFQDFAVGYAYALLGELAEAEDAAQDTFVTAFRRLALFSPERGSFGTWLLTISRNLCCNVRRKKTPVTLAVLPDETGEAGSSPRDFACRKERFEALEIACWPRSPTTTS